MSIITIFKNISETDTPFHIDIDAVLDRIKSGKSKDLIKRIQKEKEKKVRNELKKGLPAILFSGKFKKREDKYIEEHSGFICLDFDDYDSTKTMAEEKKRLMADNHVYSVFKSPSGNGLKVIVRIPPDAENHKLYFNSLEEHFSSDHFDTTSKNISRVCYESYDPLIYVNKDSDIWTKLSEPEYEEREAINVSVPITDENKVADILVKWWVKKYPMVEGERNHNAFILAAAFNDFGVNKSLARHILSSYACGDFTTKEISTTIDSAYRDTAKFGSKAYEDQDRLNDLKSKSRRGTPREEIKKELEDDGVDSVKADEIVSKVEDESGTYIYWSKSDSGKVKMFPIYFKEFLEDHGYYKYYPAGSDSYVYIRVENNLIRQVNESDIKDFVLNYLEALEDNSVYNFFAEMTKYFQDTFLNFLGTIDVNFIMDDINTAYLYYKNCAVKITKSKVEVIDYIDLDGYVWKDHIINRVFKLKKGKVCDFSKFIGNISGSDEKRRESFETTIGYLLHGHKRSSFSPAVILNDEVISDHPEGGTGKGLFMQGIGQLKKHVVIDGKQFNFDKSFAYQTLDVDTQVLTFDDVKKGFDFERLFSIITEGITIEKKNKDAVKVPFSDSPKIAITTNYAIKGAGNSHARRKWELEFKQFYTRTFTPETEFGRMMFTGWSDDEFMRFDNYMIGCIQAYLSKGLVKSEFVNLSIRQLSAETSHDFIEWCGLIEGTAENTALLSTQQILKQELYNDFVMEYPDYRNLARKTFYRWLSAYGLYKYNMIPDEGRDRLGRWIKFRRQEEILIQSKLDI